MIKEIDFKGKTLVYGIEGQGICLLFLHGFCEDRTMWNEFKKPFLENYCVLTPDLPGFGKFEAFEKISMSEMADYLNEILKEEKIDKIVLIGHSMGGYVSLAFAEKYQEKLNGFCLFHSHPFEDSEEKNANR